MHIVTDRIAPGEPCYGIRELPMLRQFPDGSARWRFVQQVFVVRGDAIAKYETDLGPEEDFEMVIPFAMISFGDDTVGELREAAERNRHDHYWRKRVQEMQESSTLMRDIVRQREMISEAVRNRSVLGPYQNTQRNGYSHVTTQRNLMALKRERTGRTQK